MPQQATTQQPAELSERNLSTVILVRGKVPFSPVLLSQEPHGIKSLEPYVYCLLVNNTRIELAGSQTLRVTPHTNDNV